MITKMDDVIDSRDVIARIEELTDEEELDSWDKEELKALLSLQEEASGSPDWIYGETLVRDTYFKDYAQELAEECGLITEGAGWPNTCIDWDQATRELQMDYTSVEFDGIDYWIRS